MATFKVGNAEYEFINSDDFTTDEWRECKTRLGLRPIEFQAAIGQLDPDCWVYQLEVSISRGGGPVTGKEFGGVVLVRYIDELYQRIQAEVAAREAASPPAGSSPLSTRSESASEPNGATGSDGETLSSETIRATSGG